MNMIGQSMKHEYTITTRSYKGEREYKQSYQMTELAHEIHTKSVKVGHHYIKVAVKLNKNGKLQGILLAEERYEL